MFREIRNKMFVHAQEELVDIIETLVTSLEYLQVAIKNKNSDEVYRWLGKCAEQSMKLSSSLKVLRFLYVKE